MIQMKTMTQGVQSWQQKAWKFVTVILCKGLNTMEGCLDIVLWPLGAIYSFWVASNMIRSLF